MRLCLFLSLLLSTTLATNIKFHENPDNKNLDAVRAPRSQKYWDKHNIKRPDYAKSDQEILVERIEHFKANLQSLLSNKPLLLVVFASISLFLYFTLTILRPRPAPCLTPEDRERMRLEMLAAAELRQSQSASAPAPAPAPAPTQPLSYAEIMKESGYPQNDKHNEKQKQN